MSRVLFVYHNELEEGFIPLSIAVLGGVAKKQGLETKVFDTSFWRDENSDIIENDREAKERTGQEKSVKGYNPQREVVNLREKFAEVVETFRPDLIAATSTSYEFNSMIDFIGPAKSRRNIPLIVGGSHPTMAPEETISHPEVDMLCRGEGETAFLELIQRMPLGKDCSNIPNLWVKTPSGIVRNKLGPLMKMDDLPDPDWDLFDLRHMVRPFQGELRKNGYFEFSRGCPNRCSYCINDGLQKLYKENGINSRNFRFRSPENATDLARRFKEKYGFDHLRLVDENLSVMPVEELERLSKLYSQQVGVGFFAMARPEGFVRNPRRAELFAEMGCELVAMGAESGNEDLKRKVLNRPMKNETLIEASRLLRGQGILVSLYNIIGFPGETINMIFDTINLNRKIRPDRFSVRFLNPYPGTEIRRYCEQKGYMHPQNRQESFLLKPVLDLPSPPHPSKQQLIEIRDNFAGFLEMPEEEYQSAKRAYTSLS